MAFGDKGKSKSLATVGPKPFSPLITQTAIEIDGMTRQSYTAEQEIEFNKLKWDYNYAFPRLVHITSRDKRNTLVKFQPTWLQSSIIHEMYKIMAFKLALGIQRAGKPALDIAARLLNVYEIKGFRWLVNEIVKFLPKQFLDRARQLGLPDDIDYMGFELCAGKPRQIGGTTTFVEIGHIDAALNPLTRVGIFSYDQASSQNIFRTVSLAHALWPADYSWCLPLDVGNSRVSLELTNGSKFEVATIGGKTNRSYFYNIVHFDEYAHYESHDMVDDIIAGVPKHCNVFKISTAIGPTGRFYEDWQKCFYIDEVIDGFDRGDKPEGWDDFAPYKWFQPWYKDPGYTLPLDNGEADEIRKSLTEYEEALLTRVPELTFGQLKWRRAKIAKYGEKDIPPEQFFAQEFPADEKEMFQPRGGQPFDVHRTEILEHKAKAIKPYYIQLSDKTLPTPVHKIRSNLTIFEKVEKGQAYLGGVDVSYGKGIKRDATVLTLWKRSRTLKKIQVAEFATKTLDPVACGHIITMLARYYNNAYLGVEANGPGEALQLTIYNENLYRNIYKTRNISQFGDKPDMVTWELGVMTTPTRKYTMVSEAIFAYREGLLEVRSLDLLQELRDFAQDDKGRYGAKEGYNDDRVMSMCIAHHIDNPMRGLPTLPTTVIPPKENLKKAVQAPETEDYDKILLKRLMKRIEKINEDERRKENGEEIQLSLFGRAINPFKD